MKRILRKALNAIRAGLKNENSELYRFLLSPKSKKKGRKRRNGLIELRDILIGLNLGDKEDV